MTVELQNLTNLAELKKLPLQNIAAPCKTILSKRAKLNLAKLYLIELAKLAKPYM